MTEKEQEAIFEAWLMEHKAILFKIIRSFALTDSDRQDLFQELSIQLWRSVPKFRGDSKVSTWIYRLALNQAMKWSAKAKAKAEKEGDHELQILHHVPESNQEDRLDWLYEQIHKLDEVDRSICLLMFEGYSYKEIGELVGITENYVGVKVNRVKQALAKKSKELT